MSEPSLRDVDWREFVRECGVLLRAAAKRDRAEWASMERSEQLRRILETPIILGILLRATVHLVVFFHVRPGARGEFVNMQYAASSAVAVREGLSVGERLLCRLWTVVFAGVLLWMVSPGLALAGHPVAAAIAAGNWLVLAGEPVWAVLAAGRRSAAGLQFQRSHTD